MSYYKKKTIDRTPFKPSFPPSPEQTAIFDALKYDDRNLHIDAKAGTGKSTTLLWAMSLMKRGSAALMAFNKEIVTDIEPKCPDFVTVKTAHSFGYAALAKKFGRLYVDDYKVLNLLKKGWPSLLNPDGYSSKEKMKVVSRLYETKELINKMRLCLVDWNNKEEIIGLIMRYNINIDTLNDVLEIIPDVFKQLMESENHIDFTDMMWMPIMLDLEIPQFDMLFIDEAQDFNNLMIAYAERMAGKRVIFVGDKFQSIYKFAGANAESIPALIEKFDAVSLPLNQCYRCGSKIIEKAQTIVPEIYAHPSTGEGVVDVLDVLSNEIEEGSMIVSRRNAGLVKPCFKLLRDGKKAIIKGRDIGGGLIRLIDQQKSSDINDLMDKLESWKEKKMEKILSSEKINFSAIDGTEDQFECVKAIAEECDSVEEVKGKINRIFSEDRKGIVLSSIHRSKGLEADHVSIINYPRVRLNYERMTDEDHQQEANLEYVSLTRAKKRLDLISS